MNRAIEFIAGSGGILCGWNRKEPQRADPDPGSTRPPTKLIYPRSKATTLWASWKPSGCKWRSYLLRGAHAGGFGRGVRIGARGHHRVLQVPAERGLAAARRG